MNTLEFENKIFDLIRNITSNTNFIFQSNYATNGLTPIQVRILLEIFCQKEATIGNLGKFIVMSSGNMSSMCKKLEQDGLVERIRDKNDERVVKVRLTQSGSNLVETIEDEMKNKYEILLNNEPKQNLTDIVNGLEKLNQLLLKLNAVNN